MKVKAIRDYIDSHLEKGYDIKLCFKEILSEDDYFEVDEKQLGVEELKLKKISELQKRIKDKYNNTYEHTKF